MMVFNRHLNRHGLTPSSLRPMVEDMLSADDVSCSSSQVSAKSEKNMADFDGEESGCEEELVQINSHAELSSHLQQHLPNLASIYHEHLVQGEQAPSPRTESSPSCRRTRG